MTTLSNSREREGKGGGGVGAETSTRPWGAQGPLTLTRLVFTRMTSDCELSHRSSLFWDTNIFLGEATG